MHNRFMQLVCLVLALCGLTAAQTKFGGVWLGSRAPVAFSATPVFDADKGNFQILTLTGNVTSSTLVHADQGQPLIFDICQDATGGRTFVPPTNVKGWTTIPSAANACSLQFFWFDGTNAMSDFLGAVAGVTFPPSPSTHSVPVITAANTATWKVVPDCTDVTGNHLNFTQSTDVWSCGTSVPANTVTTTSTQTLTNKTFGGTGSTTPNTQYNRMRANQGSAIAAGNIAISGGWGSTASVGSVRGTDAFFEFKITASGTGQSIAPTITVTFVDGSWGSNPPFCTHMPGISGGQTGTLFGLGITGETTTTLSMKMDTITPIAGATYGWTVRCEAAP